ncbi:hypothetical protein A2907_01055 [Candidatus Azambacteria bacterium RIFCSPLOWO2_01_FULL_37_9]|uniref:Uncharacterized protein n=1 Tax=Candidatus Azambacteria bacterium RIFCSPLOWO2_01_FULL_37_9 TaxID=1797297 RepID=A0A1F5C855_9BACT|nr:MAG: hypothetical protein A2907_01055 [Candidatus Azambacteria bacterium RIFCSPLOWO2_01_FULL_37_9]
MSIKIKSYFLIFALIALAGGFFSIAKGQISLLSQPISDNAIDFSVDWSAQTYVPPEYDGKAIPTYGSKIMLSATSLSLINENDYEYNWMIDLASAPNNNGKPLADFIVTKTAGNKHIIYLTISDKKTRDMLKEISFSIPITSPKNFVYAKLPGGHLYPLNIENKASINTQLDLTAKPFFFNKTDRDQTLIFQWTLNNQKAQWSESNDLSIAFPEEAGAGYQYILNLSIKNPSDLFQFTENNYKIVMK